MRRIERVDIWLFELTNRMCLKMCRNLDLLSQKNDCNICHLLCQALGRVSRIELCSTSGFYLIHFHCRRYDKYC